MIDPSSLATQSIIPSEHADNLVNPKAYADARLHDSYDWLRAHCPLGVAAVEGYDPFWVVTRHADILHVSKNNALFASGEKSPTLVDHIGDARVRQMTGGSPHLIETLIHMDGKRHLQHRVITQSWFLPKNLKHQANAIDAIATRHVAGMANKGGRCDFVADVALYYPLDVIMKIMGIPDADQPRMLRLTQELFGALDSDTNRMMAEMPPEQLFQVVQMVVTDFSQYFDAISAERRANPTDDLSSVIANATVGGEPIGALEAASYYILIATAGHDTTASSTAGAMYNLAKNPVLLTALKSDTSKIPAFVEEAIRWATPVKTFMRTATQDTMIADQPISKGDWIMLCYASGNRDEAVFENPHDFRLDRDPNPQLAFGYGAHLCLGQHLARMEMIAFFEKLIPRLKAVALDGEPKMLEATFVNGLKSLPITYDMS